MKTASSDEDLAFKQPLFRMQIGFGVAWCGWGEFHARDAESLVFASLFCFSVFSPSCRLDRSEPPAAQETKGCSGVYQEGEEIISDDGCLRLGRSMADPMEMSHR